MGVYQFQIKQYFPSLSESQRKSFYTSNIASNYELYNSFALKASEEETLKSEVLSQMYNNRLFTKALLFNSSQKMRERILTSGDSLLVENYQQYLAKMRQYNKALEMPIADREKKGISADSLYLEAQELEKQLSRQSTEFAENLEEYEPHTWQEIQAKLKKNEVAIELIRFNWHNKKWTDTVYYAALIVTPDTKNHPDLVLLENGKALEGKFSKYYHNMVKIQGEDKFSYRQFWQPIEAKLQSLQAFEAGKKGRIYLSLDGVYYQINLATLQNPETGKYLGESYDLQLVSNTKDLLKAPSQYLPSKKGLIELFGYPLYDKFPEQKADSTKREKDEFDYLINPDRGLQESENEESEKATAWQMLEGTKAEVENIVKIIQKQLSVKEHLGQEASETALKAVRSPLILHIATHGYFLPDIQDTTNRQMAGSNTYDLRKNPLLRSGLIFAGGNQTWLGNPPEKGDNGILTAQEAKELYLDETQLVILSACETGKGEIQNGEGIFGLQRAFLSAGSNYVLNSLWKVNDEATQLLMTYFYENLSQSKDIRKAFEQAKQKLRAYESGKYDQPKFWGAFVLVGR